VDLALVKGPTPSGFVGLANYARAFSDPVFLGAVRFSLIFAFCATAVELAVGFFLAYLLVGEHLGNRIARTILILPAMIAPVAVGTMWRMMLNNRAGLIGIALHAIGINSPDWFARGNTALIALIGIDIWQHTPFVFIIYSAALAALPTDPIRAATVDGASRWQILRYIILPLLLPVTLIILMFRLIDSLMVLDIIYTTTRGGPGFATFSMTFWTYAHGLEYFNMSYAAAMSWILLAMCVLIAVVLMSIRGRWLNIRK
jgi:ABC-type sugar transport system permease subunit